MILSFDIGGTSIKYGLLQLNGKIKKTKAVDTEAYLGGQHIVKNVLSIINSYMNRYSIEGIALSTAGMVNPEKGTIIYSGKNIPDYIGIEWKKIIESTYSIPCEVENDSNCAGLAEAINGAGKNHQHVVCVTVGTGIGSSLIIDKRLYHGGNNQAMEIGYMNMEDTIYENLASTSALVNRVVTTHSLDSKDINGEIIFKEAMNGNQDYIKEIEKMFDYLARGLSHLCYSINPDVIVLGGGIMEQKEFLKPILDKKMEKYVLKDILNHIDIQFAEFGNNAGLIGAFENFKTKRF